MFNTEGIVKIYDRNKKKLLGSGHLLNMNDGMISVKGNELPILDINTEIYIEVYTVISGISPYFCKVAIASINQLNAQIIKMEPNMERRQSLKIRTDLSFYIEELYRNDEDITKDFSNMKINILNLSIGGMLISSNYDLKINDILAINFQYEKSQKILLKAKVIRIDNIAKKLSSINYGCKFEKMSAYNEAVITKYLFDRQLQLYKNR